ncbi:MAG: ABC transporter permease [Thermoanaerobaculia bacterium]
MSYRELFRFAIENLAAHKLRALLTMLGIVFGVGSVIAMLAIGTGAERQALEMIGRLGRDNLVLRARELKDDELTESRKRSIGLAWRDVFAIGSGLPGVRSVSPKVEIAPYQIYGASGSTRATLFGVGADYDRLVALELEEGRFLDDMDIRDHAQVAVIGPAVRRDLFGFEPALGATFKVNDVWLEVVGVLAASGVDTDAFEGVRLGPASSVVFVPVSTAERKFDRDPKASPFSEIVVQMNPGSDVRSSAAGLSSLMDRLHAGAPDYELVVPEALLAQSRRTQRLFKLVMGSIAGISLLVGGIGITNIMLASVLERTREIGLRRAVGAREIDIRRQFLIEAFAISLIGAAVGIVVGVALAASVATWAGWKTEVTVGSVALASLVALAVGVLSGFYPARRAAALDPIDALRYE